MCGGSAESDVAPDSETSDPSSVNPQIVRILQIFATRAVLNLLNLSDLPPTEDAVFIRDFALGPYNCIASPYTSFLHYHEFRYLGYSDAHTKSNLLKTALEEVT
jgi:hypothetical protein